MAITDEEMTDRLAQAKPYTLMILHKTSKYGRPGTPELIQEHGRRNFELVQDGSLSIVCPVRDDTDVAGIGIFNRPLAEVQDIYNQDPAVKAGLLRFELHATLGFPGSSLP